MNVCRPTNQCDAQTDVFVCTSLQPFCLAVVVVFWRLVVSAVVVGFAMMLCGLLRGERMWLVLRYLMM